MAKDDQWIVDTEVSYWKSSWFQPYVAYRYFGGVGEGSPHPGSFWWLGIKRKQPFSLWGKEMPLSIDVQFAFSDGALGREGKHSGFVYGRLTVFQEIAITEHLALLPHVIWQGAPSYGGPLDYAERQNVFVYGMTLRIQF